MAGARGLPGYRRGGGRGGALGKVHTEKESLLTVHDPIRVHALCECFAGFSSLLLFIHGLSPVHTFRHFYVRTYVAGACNICSSLSAPAVPRNAHLFAFHPHAVHANDATFLL